MCDKCQVCPVAVVGPPNAAAIAIKIDRLLRLERLSEVTKASIFRSRKDGMTKTPDFSAFTDAELSQDREILRVELSAARASLHPVDVVGRCRGHLAQIESVIAGRVG